MYKTYEVSNQGEVFMKKTNRALSSIIVAMSLLFYSMSDSREVFKVVCDILSILNITSITSLIGAAIIGFNKSDDKDKSATEKALGDSAVCCLALVINTLCATILIPFIDSKLMILVVAQTWLFATMTMQISIDTVDRLSHL